MANVNSVEITKSGMEASILNSSNRNGFKIEIGKADVISNGQRIGTVECYGVGQLNNVVTIAAEIESDWSYDITQLNFYDSISDQIFAIAKPPAGGVIDNVQAGKKCFVCLTIGFMILPEGTVTVKTKVDNYLSVHESSETAHADIFNQYVNYNEVISNPNLSYDIADVRKVISAKYLHDIYNELEAFKNSSNDPIIEWKERKSLHQDLMVNGFVVKFNDGLIHQVINIKNVNTADRGIFRQQRNSLIVDIPPLENLNNIFSVDIYLYESSGEGHSTKTREADEWLTSWHQTASGPDNVRINLKRWTGTFGNQNINMRVVLKGIN